MAAVVFRAAVAQLQYEPDDVAAGTAILRRAESGFNCLASAAYALRAVTRCEHAPFAADLKLREEIDRQRAALLSRLSLRLAVEDNPECLENLGANPGKPGRGSAWCAVCTWQASWSRAAPAARRHS
ncbi:MAG: hypothetical protein IPK20_00460 [Betaproteobacteria bacterium]|nr:hypothetical protein [Betaproteobacteria bacterium]